MSVQVGDVYKTKSDNKYIVIGINEYDDVVIQVLQDTEYLYKGDRVYNFSLFKLGTFVEHKDMTKELKLELDIEYQQEQVNKIQREIKWVNSQEFIIVEKLRHWFLEQNDQILLRPLREEDRQDYNTIRKEEAVDEPPISDNYAYVDESDNIILE